ncbi:DUF559 domain-containing protein [Gulosibacter macacae]|uniref:DUF559 domain-containing protein n=2 Tax=Gulosibacter macacae TaxID=2488791 RepID=A0A3P3W686_9MICO|nr:DUF559 domain-containing protein [Gulosibacter macacae]
MTTPLNALLQRNHGVLTTAGLLQHGWSKRQIASALATDQLECVRRGYYIAAGSTPTDAGVAALAGGSLSCVNALSAHKLWVPHGVHGRHFRLTKKQATLWPDSVVRARFGRASDTVHVLPGKWLNRIEGAIDPIPTALVTASRCISNEDAIAAIESAMKKKVLDLETFRVQAAQAPPPINELLAQVQPGADSGLETIVRLRLLAAGLPVRAQVDLAGWSRDLLIGEWLVVEIDGFEFHSTRDAMNRDVSKDRHLTLSGYTFLRFTYEDVIYRWDACLAQVLAAVAAGWHLRPRA